MPAEKISLQNAKENKLFYFVANVVVYRESDGRCLILKRSEKEKVHPGKYCVPGGKLEWGQLDITRPTRLNGDVLDFEDVVEELLVREAREEAGLDVEKDLKYINSVAFVRPDGIPVILVKFAAKYKDGEVVVEDGAFVDHAWVNEDEVENYECIKGISEEIYKTIELFRTIDKFYYGKSNKSVIENNMLKLGKYKHYKGKEYEVIGFAKHSETLEELVVYRALYGSHDLWVRPFKIFTEEVEIDRKKVPMFEYIGE